MKKRNVLVTVNQEERGQIAFVNSEKRRVKREIAKLRIQLEELDEKSDHWWVEMTNKYGLDRNQDLEVSSSTGEIAIDESLEDSLKDILSSMGLDANGVVISGSSPEELKNRFKDFLAPKPTKQPSDTKLN